MTTETDPGGKRILLAVTGLTAQVVTETLYALAHRRDDPWIPHEIHLITTAPGAENAYQHLLAYSTGWFHRLVEDYALPPITFTADHIHVLKDGDGIPLEDIRTPAQNSLTANFITETVRRLTAAGDGALHVSIAGGRKTMGFYLGYALSLFGRPQDRLSHVLVSEPFEGSRQFYYPTPYDHPVTVRIGPHEQVHNAREALVELAEIPFVSLRHGLPDALLGGDTSFQETVDAVNTSLGPPSLRLDARTRKVQFSHKTFVLSVNNFAVLAVLAQRAKHRLGPLKAPIKYKEDLPWSQAFLHTLREACGPFNGPVLLEEKLELGVDGDWFSPIFSRLRVSLGRQLGPVVNRYFANTRGQYQLLITPESIAFGPLESS